MMNKPETRLQQKIRKALTKVVGGWWIKIHGSSFQRRGLPDLHGTVRGLSIWIEVKMPGEVPTELQEATLAEINRKGKGFAFWATTVKEATDRVKEYLDKGGGPSEKETIKESSRKRKSSSKISRRT